MTYNAAYHKRHREENRERYRRYERERRHRLKQIRRDAKNKPCADCGQQFPYYVMEFDHREDKTWTISEANHLRKAALLAEIAKCDVVCSNCHKIREHQRLEPTE